MAHGSGGRLVEGAPLAPIGCLLRTGFNSWEPNVGVTKSGAVLQSARVYPNPGGQIGAALSTDEGASWSLVEPSAGPVRTHPASIDPYLHVDPTTSRVFLDDLLTPNCSVISWSDDDGATWDHSYSGCLETDHQTIFAGKPVSSATVGYPNVVYRCTINTLALAGLSTTSTCQRSLDGGRAWLPPGAPAFVTPADALPDYCDGALGHGIVDDTGRVWLPKGLCGQPWLAWSDDEGLSWERVQVASTGMNRNAGNYPGHEAGVGVDPAGMVYYFWVAEDRLPYLSISDDRGASWSAPLMVAPPGLIETTLPELTVGGTGKIAFVYLGSTNSPGQPWPMHECDIGECIDEYPPLPEYDDTTWNGYIGVSFDASAPEPTFYTAAVNAPDAPLVRGICEAVRCPSVGDFLDIRIAPDGTPWAALVDACVDECPDGPGGTTENEGVVGRLWGAPSLWDEGQASALYGGG